MLKIDEELAMAAIAGELEQANHGYPLFNSPHEGLAVLEEEFEELKQEVFKNCKSRDLCLMCNGAAQVGAMAAKMIVSIQQWRKEDKWQKSV